MRPARMGAYAAGLAALIAGCSVEVQAPGTELLQTDRTEYRLRARWEVLETDISFTFTNRTRATVYIANCMGSAPTSLEKNVNGDWIPAWSPVFLLCASPAITVRPGARYADTLHVVAGLPLSNVGPEFRVEEVPGIYRLVWPSASLKNVALPLEYRVSNPFQLTTP